MVAVVVMLSADPPVARAVVEGARARSSRGVAVIVVVVVVVVWQQGALVGQGAEQPAVESPEMRPAAD